MLISVQYSHRLGNVSIEHVILFFSLVLYLRGIVLQMSGEQGDQVVFEQLLFQKTYTIHLKEKILIEKGIVFTQQTQIC